VSDGPLTGPRSLGGPELFDDPCELAVAVLRDPHADELARRRAVAHLDSCLLCRAERGERSSDPRSSVEASTVETDQHGSLAGLRLPKQRRSERVVLAGLSGVQFALAVPWLFGANPFDQYLGSVATDHLARDGALGATMAVAGLVSTWRPRYAFPMLTLVVAVVVMQIAGGVKDLQSGHLHFELVHALEAAIAVLIVRAARQRDLVPEPRWSVGSDTPEQG
jgi:hypothetical protein